MGGLGLELKNGIRRALDCQIVQGPFLPKFPAKKIELRGFHMGELGASRRTLESSLHTLCNQRLSWPSIASGKPIVEVIRNDRGTGPFTYLADSTKPRPKRLRDPLFIERGPRQIGLGDQERSSKKIR